MQKKLDTITNQMAQIGAVDDVIPNSMNTITYNGYATGKQGLKLEKEMVKTFEKLLNDPSKSHLHGYAQSELVKWKSIVQGAEDYKKLYKAQQKLIKDLAALNTKQPKPLLQPLMKQAKQLTSEMDNLAKKEYINLWKNPVTAADYQGLSDQGSIIAKKQYFYGKLQKATDPSDINKFQGYLDDLEELIIKGQEYSAKNQLYQTLNNQIRAISNPNDAYTKARKDAALWFKSKPAADKVMRQRTGEIWRGLTAKQKEAAYDYTSGSGKFNRPLRGYDGSWNKSAFKGVGKVPLNNEGGESMIKALAKAMETSDYDFDIWLNRGVSESGLSGFVGLSEAQLQSMTQAQLEKALVGKVVKDEAFLSTSAYKGGGFGGDIVNVYAPKGTKMMYAEPYSAYGEGARSPFWDGIQKQSDFGGEFEIIINKGYNYKITKVEKQGWKVFIDVDVIL